MREMPGVHIDQNRCSHKSECALILAKNKKVPKRYFFIFSDKYISKKDSFGSGFNVSLIIRDLYAELLAHMR